MASWWEFESDAECACSQTFMIGAMDMVARGGGGNGEELLLREGPGRCLFEIGLNKEGQGVTGRVGNLGQGLCRVRRAVELGEWGEDWS